MIDGRSMSFARRTEMSNVTLAQTMHIDGVGIPDSRLGHAISEFVHDIETALPSQSASLRENEISDDPSWNSEALAWPLLPSVD
jgi:hypothetical protein